MANAPRSRLVIVSGAPGSGKTTLARIIGARLSCPVISRDEIKEGLMLARGDGTPLLGAPIAVEAFEVFYRTVSDLLRSGCSVVAEAAFRSDFIDATVALVNVTNSSHIHCHVDQATAARRFADRAAAEIVRRKAHPDEEILTAMTDRTFEWAMYESLELGVPTLNVDTTGEYNPNLSDVVSFSSGLGAPTS